MGKNGMMCTMSMQERLNTDGGKTLCLLINTVMDDLTGKITLYI